jgi:hypothetical protein
MLIKIDENYETIIQKNEAEVKSNTDTNEEKTEYEKQISELHNTLQNHVLNYNDMALKVKY